MIKERLGEIMRITRAKKQLSQQEAAKEVNLSVGGWNNIERGKNSPSIELAEEILRFCEYQINLEEVKG